jgi:hypothetical protein
LMDSLEALRERKTTTVVQGSSLQTAIHPPQTT